MPYLPLKRLRVSFRDYKRSRRAKARAALVAEQTPVFVHTHGKVGSSTVSATIHDAFGDAYPIFHTHVIAEHNRARARRKYAARPRGGSEPHLLSSDALAPYLEALPFPCYVVTLTRDPVGRAISHTMQTLRSWAPADFFSLDLDEQVRLSTLRVDDLLGPERDVSDPSEWFDEEIQGIFGVDVFAEPYDFEQGYAVLENGPIRVLVMRMEDLDGSLAPALSDLFQQNVGASIRNANVGSKKPYAAVLKALKRSYRPDPARAERVFSGRYYQHFYAADPTRV